MASEKVIIIGAGIAGLATGSYLEMNGYDTTIFELHERPGGLCTSWRRKGYTFDGCIRWLLGSGPASPFHALWRELIDLDSLTFIYHERFVEMETRTHRDPDGSNVYAVYCDLDRQERYMKRIAPDDAEAIEEFLSVARRLQKYDFPPLIDKAPAVRSWRDRLRMLALLPLWPMLRRWSAVTNVAFARRLRSPFLREVFENMFDGRESSLLATSMMQAWLDQRSAGYPIGGSKPIAEAMADRYHALGGSAQYRRRVAEILVENDHAVGVKLADGSRHRADLVVSAADGHFTIFDALGGRYADRPLRELYAGRTLERFPSLVQVSLGVSRSFEGTFHCRRLQLDEILKLPDGSEHSQLNVRIYNYDPTLAPEGCTVVVALLETREFDFWHRLRREDRPAYLAAKERVADQVVAILDRRLGDVEKHLDVVDVSTPATIYRHTNNWQGSYEGWRPPRQVLKAKPLSHELPGLRNFFMVGQWVQPGGGLPPAIMHGRQLAQTLCQRAGRPFRVLAA